MNLFLIILRRIYGLPPASIGRPEAFKSVRQALESRGMRLEPPFVVQEGLREYRIRDKADVKGSSIVAKVDIHAGEVISIVVIPCARRHWRYSLMNIEATPVKLFLRILRRIYGLPPARISRAEAVERIRQAVESRGMRLERPFVIKEDLRKYYLRDKADVFGSNIIARVDIHTGEVSSVAVIPY